MASFKISILTRWAFRGDFATRAVVGCFNQSVLTLRNCFEWSNISFSLSLLPWLLVVATSISRTLISSKLICHYFFVEFDGSPVASCACMPMVHNFERPHATKQSLENSVMGKANFPFF
jgi:hypothetical protein